ncbi:MAG: methyl-accepting chemotaxis protein, partial [Treponema sp.]|nr:methyl-accepting chemotaxis protein [Treponema sp.]
MSKKNSVRFSLTIKLLIIFLVVVIIANIVIGTVTYRISSKSLTQSVFNHLSAVSDDISNQIVAINKKHFTCLHFLAEEDFMKDESTSLEEKLKQLSPIVKALGENYENIAFYDKDGNAITADGRLINMKDRDYFKAAM